eukprot:CAMPEP_0168613934 /NCGR_PEP_ID=MMETSP0449_2-20121227/3710_1 /TAXON_ID=1082188 /ORGANISM="Strombidium rassoulzadegani, Strain ras09" /LENGTH=270 /DNA_ID=CAMNT_0008654589 /DNA_START=9 /DNA_END=821 /DNA_ORIENTATION=-
MVFHNTISMRAMPGYEDETWRSKHGYKELHQHDAPYRRNRDFKPMTYGSWKGIPNYKHSEAWCHLKNLKDIANESHHHPIKYAKKFITGAILGFVYGQLWVLGGPQSGIELNKLLASAGPRPWSGQYWRILSNTSGKHMMIGGALVTSYEMITDLLRRHDEVNTRPRSLDHAIAITLIGLGIGSLTFNSPKKVFLSGFFSLMLVAPITFYMGTYSKPFDNEHPVILYENTCTEEEIERFRMQDHIEQAGLDMIKMPGFGYHSSLKDPRGV